MQRNLVYEVAYDVMVRCQPLDLKDFQVDLYIASQTKRLLMKLVFTASLLGVWH